MILTNSQTMKFKVRNPFRNIFTRKTVKLYLNTTFYKYVEKESNLRDKAQ